MSNIKKMLPKNYRELICEKDNSITPKQISRVMSGETKNLVWIKTVKTNITAILKELGHKNDTLKDLW